MNQERLFKVLLGPHITEKSASATGSAAQVAFKVATDASKLEVKKAVEKLFEVKVDGVRVVNVKGKRPYATAIEFAASTVSSVASKLGYCSPPLTKCIEPYRPTANNDMATCTTPKFVRKLAVDDKQGLTIDPRISGCADPDDALSIVNIAGRESFLCSFDWPQSASAETLLWNARVSPVIWSEEGLTGSIHLPAMAYVGMLGHYWTGTLYYRFQVVRSGFHNGRLKIMYDPNYNAQSTEYNVNQMKIVNIADEDDFTYAVGVGQKTSYMEHARPGLDGVTEVWSTTEYTSSGPGNGVIGVYVLNDLTTPSDSTVNNDIQVNVFVRAGPDFRIANPDNHFTNFVFKPQMGEEVTPSNWSDWEEDMHFQAGVNDVSTTMQPYSPETEIIAAKSVNAQTNLNKVYFGEEIISLKTLLMRYNMHSVLTRMTSSNTEILNGRRCMFPYLRGNVAGAVDVIGTANYNFCNTVLLHWVVSAFAGWRGSIRYSLSSFGSTGNTRAMFYSVSRSAGDGDDSYANGALPLSDAGTNLTQMRRSNIAYLTPGGIPSPLALSNMTEGALIENGYTNGNIDFELPFYSNARFVPAKQEDYTSAQLWLENWDYRIITDGNAADTRFFSSVAAGDDFKTYMFTGLPPVYFEATPPGVTP
jgi:ribosomal protein L23